MPLLELRGVGKSYGSGNARREVLSDINLAIEEGEFVAIVGFSGSGKTTLVSTIAGLSAPDAGLVTVRGRPVHAGRRLVLTDGKAEVPFVDDGSGNVVTRGSMTSMSKAGRASVRVSCSAPGVSLGSAASRVGKKVRCSRLRTGFGFVSWSSGADAFAKLAPVVATIRAAMRPAAR